LPREMLYIADEIFLTGTAAEVTPVRSVDKITVGSGRRGPVTEALQSAFFGLFNGKTEDKWGWLEPCRSEGSNRSGHRAGHPAGAMPDCSTRLAAAIAGGDACLTNHQPMHGAALAC